MKLTPAEILVLLAAQRHVVQSEIKIGSLFRRVNAKLEDELKKADPKSFKLWKLFDPDGPTGNPLNWN